MIPLQRHNPPSYFESEIHAKGMKWLEQNNIQLNVPAPPNTQFPSYWTKCLPDLHTLYNGQCAYTCLYIHPATGAKTVDHILSKTNYPELAYTWSNYCLACQRINTKKGERTGLLNPFDVSADLFRLILKTGKIIVNHNNPQAQKALVTLSELDLNNQTWKEARKTCYVDYVDDLNNGTSPEHASERLKKASQFVWSEVKRQGFLR